MTEKLRKNLTTALKISVSVALIYFIFTKIDFKDVAQVLSTAKPLWLLSAFLLFVFSKILNAFRLNLYFHVIDVKLTQLSNLKLYLLGMFYNLFLPGGIGGDAYKGYVIQKRFQVGTRKVVGVLLLDRLSGLLLILIIAFALGALLPIAELKPFRWLFLLAIPIGTLIFWWMNKRFFSYALKAFWGAFYYSASLQLVQMLAAFCIIKALSIEGGELTYLFIFMISTIISVIPLTIGGIGSREVTFLYGAKLLGLDTNTAIGISFTFFLISALVSLFGIYFHFKKPALELQD